MKKFIKNNIFGFILGIILCGGIVYGVNTYESNTIEYSPTDTSWNVSNVNEAINSLYSIKTELDATKTELDSTKTELNSTQTSLNNLKGIGDATAAQILSGKKAVVKGSTLTGTMTNRGAWTNTPTGSGKVTIPAGYHNGSGYVNTATVYTNGYNAGVAAGKPTKTQTVSNTYTLSQGNYVYPVFTFSNLTTVTGITAYNETHIADAIVYNMKISGNTVTFTIFCDEHTNVSTTVTITAIGY